MKSYQNNYSVAHRLRIQSDCGCHIPNLILKRLVDCSIHTLVSRENTDSNEKTFAKYSTFSERNESLKFNLTEDIVELML